MSISVPYSKEIVNSIYFNLNDTIGVKQTKIFKKSSGFRKDGWRIEIRNSESQQLKFYVFNADTLKKYKKTLTIRNS